ncbi:MAG: transglutaminase domain protein, partial [Candidatus Eremiobacteraeota bacterium]|nr:transglutaminase domain protein [Candidatus Eremiobacteraeota bacterium]
MTALKTRHSLEAFLASDEFIESRHPAIVEHASRLRGTTDVEAAERVFRFVRDDVAHSWDIQGRRVTRTASDVLAYREGICYAKSHLAAALLRAAGIPSGICYQRLTLLDDDSAGYVIQALNTVWLESLKRWIRFDARGNKPGIAAEFSVVEERLAFPIRAQYDEIDYFLNYPAAHPVISAALTAHDDAQEMCREHLPAALSDAY